MLLPLLLLLGGCVVKQYGSTVSSGAAEQSLAPVDFSATEAELERLIASERENVDRRDRLEAAWELLQQVKTSRPAAQHVVQRYLARLVALEQRAANTDTDALASEHDARFTPIASIKGEDIQVSEPAVDTAGAQSQLPIDAGAAAILDASRRRMNGGDLTGAMAQLEVCKAQACWAEVEGLWGEVRDRVVYQEQERAGQAYLAARALQDKTIRLEKLQEARRILAGIQSRYPNTRYAQGIADKIARVDASISEAIAN
jgi:hypothetical protein